jgi:hypothetical protein
VAVVGKHIAALPNTVILKTLNVFTNKFPELAIMHVPTFMAELGSRPLSREIMALLGAVLAVTQGQLAVLGASWADMLLTREEYALYTREMLSQFILQPPKLQVVQILLIITLYEWGTRNFHKAWMYCGKSFCQPLQSARTFAIIFFCSFMRDGLTYAGVKTRHRYSYHASPSQPTHRPVPA